MHIVINVKTNLNLNWNVYVSLSLKFAGQSELYGFFRKISWNLSLDYASFTLLIHIKLSQGSREEQGVVGFYFSFIYLLDIEKVPARALWLVSLERTFLSVFFLRYLGPQYQSTEKFIHYIIFISIEITWRKGNNSS